MRPQMLPDGPFCLHNASSILISVDFTSFQIHILFLKADLKPSLTLYLAKYNMKYNVGCCTQQKNKLWHLQVQSLL